MKRSSQEHDVVVYKLFMPGLLGAEGVGLVYGGEKQREGGGDVGVEKG